MGSSETKISNAILLEATRRGWRLFKNPSGVCTYKGRTVRFGLCKGSSDLIGWRPVPGSHAQFVAIEVKTQIGRATREQQRFIDVVNAMGGYAKICRKPKDL